MFTVKINKKPKIDTVEPGLLNPVHEIPALIKGGKEKIDLSVFPEWEELQVHQQRYLLEFSKQNLKKKRAAVTCRIDTKKIDSWLKRDENFNSIYNSIIDLHAEALEEMDYQASFDPKNNISRGRFLSKRSKLYKETPDEPVKQPRIGKQTNILAVLNSGDVTSKGLAGVQQMFNSLKEKGMEVPSGTPEPD